MLRVTILLSTYNGNLFINDQIVSIHDQNNIEFKIVIRDDGSSDNTLVFLKEYSRKYLSKIHIYEDDNGNIGIKKSFDILLNITESDYYLFADQDDIWLPNKLSRLTEVISKMNNDKPAMVFSDMDLIDSFGKIFFNSFIKRKLRLTEGLLKSEFLQGHISGCLMMFNNAAKEYYLKYKTQTVLHDYHMLMMCFLFGNVSFHDESLVLHRIHNSNVVGVGKKVPLLTEIKDLIKYFFNNEDYRNILFTQYLTYIEDIRNYPEVEKICKIKRIYNRMEIKQLNYIQRKRWYYKHFFSLEKGIIREFIKFLLF